jgi:hypothetical protein
MARIIYKDFREPAAAEACDIAFNFLVGSSSVQDEFETAVFLAEYLTEMVDHGHTNKILMANRAIAAYQRRRGLHEEHLGSHAPQDRRHVAPAASQSMEEIFETWLAGPRPRE